MCAQNPSAGTIKLFPSIFKQLHTRHDAYLGRHGCYFLMKIPHLFFISLKIRTSFFFPGDICVLIKFRFKSVQYVCIDFSIEYFYFTL